MITIKNICMLDGSVSTLSIPSTVSETIDAEGKLTALPACIDEHVHCRVPGDEHKEDWKTAAKAAIAGGITSLFDMPNNTPPCVTKKDLVAKSQQIDQQLKEVGIPLRYKLWLGAHQDHFDEISHCKGLAVGVKAYMGSSTGGLLLNDPAALEELFRRVALENMILALHAEDEKILSENQRLHADVKDPKIHSLIRHRKAAISATKQALTLAEKYNTPTFFMHITTKEEVELIRQAKSKGILVYAETTPHHLFLNESAYASLGTRAQMNPPLRTAEDQKALWDGINDGTIDTIGSDHAPHTLAEKDQPYGKAPSGVPGLETLLPLLLQAYNDKKITLGKIVQLTRTNAETIFNFYPVHDFVLVDLNLQKKVEESALHTKCKWSPFTGQILKGWPVITIVQGKVFHVTSL